MDIVWEHGENTHPGFKCNYCRRIWKGGGAARFKQHLSGTGSSVTSCPSVPPDVRDLFRQKLEREREEAVAENSRKVRLAQTASFQRTKQSMVKEAISAGVSGVYPHLVKVTEGDGRTSKRDRRGADLEEEHGAKRLKGTIASDAFSCNACTKPLKPPVFQCSMGHFFFCSTCHDKLVTCKICTGGSRLERSYGMDCAVQSVLVDCRYADYGCQRKTALYNKESHENACPHAPHTCLYSGCGFAGLATEVLAHLTAHHKSPCTEFTYWHQFSLCVEPGVHVIRCKDDGQHFLVHTQHAEQPCGYAVSIGCIPPCVKEGGIGCSVSFKCSDKYTGISTLLNLQSSLADCTSTPMEYLCFVPKVPSRPDKGDAGVVLNVNIETDEQFCEDEEPSEDEVSSEDEEPSENEVSSEDEVLSEDIYSEFVAKVLKGVSS